MTSISIAAEIQRFLSSSRPEVLCIKGEWGVGKTYTWNNYLQESKAKGMVSLMAYSYVSLFGINNLDQLRYAIFENTISTRQQANEPSMSSFHDNARGVIEQLGRKSLCFIPNLPLPAVKEMAGGFLSLAALSISERLICIDDFDRKGVGLHATDVLGLISSLKEQRRCKIVLILNDDALVDDAEQFKLHFEKVVDSSITFKPTPRDCASIAIQGNDKTDVALREACIHLEIANIRIIKRIERLILLVVPELKDFDAAVEDQAIKTIAVFAWGKFGNGPSIEFLADKRSKTMFGVTKPDELSPDEARWDRLLDKLGFTNVDEFDAELLEGVNNGYFDLAKLRLVAGSLNEEYKKASDRTLVQNAWRLFHGSFDDNTEQVVEEVVRAFRRGYRVISPSNADATIELLKYLGHQNLTPELIEIYIE